MSSSVWSLPPQNLQLADHDIHIWLAELDQSVTTTQRLRNLLSEDERSRAERFRFEQHRQRFIVGRGVLRSLLSHYLNLDPAAIQFSYGENGKPALAPPSTSSLSFNLSHSHGLCLYAFVWRSPIGIDLEYQSPQIDREGIVRRYFSAREQSFFDKLALEQRQTAFLTIWTGKEAYLKAVGTGLTTPLRQVEVAFHPHQSARFLSIAEDESLAAAWSLYSFKPATDYQAAIAIQGDHWTLHWWQY
jgi:4'-phosphopantetheinyl transferase